MMIKLIDAEGRAHEVPAQEGLSVMEVLREAGLIEGECGGSLACATCHVWVDAAWADRFAPPVEDEEDMLDVAFNLTDRSRLSCQLILGPEHDGLTISLPRNS